MYLLDTDICSYFLRGRYGLHDKFDQAGLSALHISRITVAELLVLAHKNPASRINERTIVLLAQTLAFVDLDEPAWATFPVIKARLERAGRPAGDFDILQASIAQTRDLVLVTNNEAHYRAMEVRLENWVTAGP
jgi:tRNA(fMet)-specific endonuclease VapC